jgi:hypothetical protein
MRIDQLLEFKSFDVGFLDLNHLSYGEKWLESIRFELEKKQVKS